ncbi:MULTISPECIES: hypothetical protein [Aeromonas]|uniref:hypothetical protein n=1 Tax=Aeromonas TaxID=642 RepID=UPI0015DCAE1B|nr:MULTISPECIES: hypothetical protein [Aeromonas]HEB5077425.1 hypothetical protein [Aeromonas hydrophila subsp. hydrophila]MCR3951200.1 hypothetical protein [Aeromonas hydrophila]UBQ51457.1 hypothetical protein LCH17_04830 [Aeromonas hydrophila]BBT05858.1 hypothetical protein WP7S18E06_13570 [Aeromonas hydrophila]HDI1212527.1 hypothetical protein [Aeromonas hydrophila]
MSVKGKGLAPDEQALAPWQDGAAQWTTYMPSKVPAALKQHAKKVSDGKRGVLAMLVLPTIDQLKYIFSQCGSSFSFSFTI